MTSGSTACTSGRMAFTASTTGVKLSPSTFWGTVTCGVSMVDSPMTATLTPLRSMSVQGAMPSGA